MSRIDKVQGVCYYQKTKGWWYGVPGGWYAKNAADCLMTNYANWRPRAEISGEGNIEEGFRMEHPGVEIVTKYGFYGETAKWEVQGLHMKGGAGQMNIVFSWGTCKKAGIITNVGKTTIN